MSEGQRSFRKVICFGFFPQNTPALPARCVHSELMRRKKQFLNSLGGQEKGLGSRESWLLLLGLLVCNRTVLIPEDKMSN